MLKLFFLCRRRADLTRDEYARCVLEGHVPLALKHHTTMRRYTVNVSQADPTNGAPYDSLPSLSFGSLEDFRKRLYDSSEGQAIIHADVQRFMGGSVAYATREIVRKDETDGPRFGARTPGLKWICLLARPAGWSHEAFVDHWTNVHGPLALKHQPGFSKYVQNVVEEKLSPDGDEWDGIAEVYYASERDQAERRYDSEAGRRAIEDDIARFTARVVAYPVAEYPQK